MRKLLTIYLIVCACLSHSGTETPTSFPAKRVIVYSSWEEGGVFMPSDESTFASIHFAGFEPEDDEEAESGFPSSRISIGTEDERKLTKGTSVLRSGNLSKSHRIIADIYKRHPEDFRSMVAYATHPLTPTEESRRIISAIIAREEFRDLENHRFPIFLTYLRKGYNDERERVESIYEAQRVLGEDPPIYFQSLLLIAMGNARFKNDRGLYTDARTLAQKYKNKRLEAAAALGISRTYVKTNRRKAIEFLGLAEELALQTDDEHLKARVYLAIGQNYKGLSQIEPLRRAYFHVSQTYHSFEKIKILLCLARCVSINDLARKRLLATAFSMASRIGSDYLQEQIAKQHETFCFLLYKVHNGIHGRAGRPREGLSLVPKEEKAGWAEELRTIPPIEEIEIRPFFHSLGPPRVMHEPARVSTGRVDGSRFPRGAARGGGRGYVPYGPMAWRM